MEMSLTEEAAGPKRDLRILWMFIAAVVVLLAPMADYLTQYQLGFSIFYVVPVVLVSWYVSRFSGMIISVAAVGVWTLVELGTEEKSFFSLMTYWGVGIRLAVFGLLAYLVSALRASLSRETQLARTDPLTGAANTRCFLELAGGELSRSRRYRRPFTVTYMDLDNFKAINDQLGHRMGDMVLRTVAQTVSKNVRTTDVVARIGGDEFVMLFPETGHPNGTQVLEKVWGLLNEAMEENDWAVTFSLGGATFVTPPDSVDEVLRKADDLMYEAKRAGKNQMRMETFGDGAAAD